MSIRRPPRWLQNVLIGLLIVSGLALVVIPQIDIPHPLVSNPEDSAEKILRVEQHRRWVVTHSYGALSAQNVGIREIRERADALPEGLRSTYYDGAAHHQRVDFDELDAWLDQIDEYIPADKQRLYHDGIMRLFTREQGRNPQRVLDFATELSNKTRTQDLSNGIRIGIQQEFGDDIREAIQIALKYPNDLYYPLFEELGWRLGHDHGADPKYWREHESILPEKAQCWLAEGMTRGTIILMIEDDEIWWPDIISFRNGISSTCGPEVASGVAEALLIVLGDNPDTMIKQLDQVESPEDREMVERILETKQGTEDAQQLEALPNADPDLPPIQ